MYIMDIMNNKGTEGNFYINEKEIQSILKSKIILKQ